MGAVKHLDWDTSFFGFPVASVVHSENAKTNQLLNSFCERGYKLVYLFVPQNVKKPEAALLEKYCGLLADRKITYKFTFSEMPKPIICPNIRINEFSQVNKSLVKLAIAAGEYSRFHTDPNFSEVLFRRLYERWIENSVSGKMADFVITYHMEKRIVGLITLKISGESAKIGLISVDKKIQGKGIGTSLIHEVISLAYQQGVSAIEVVTQEDNFEACRFYEAQGFIKYNFEFVYHFWLKNNDTL